MFRFGAPSWETGSFRQTVQASDRPMKHPHPVVPVTVIAGYLGAGKTSLLNHIVTHRETSHFAILVNDFGALNIDADLIELQGGQAFRLESGCICCNIGNSLIFTLLSILRSELRPERILIEASGVADPTRIADIARLSRSLSLDGVVVLVDCERIRSLLEDRLVGETVRNQLEAAELLLLNKRDLVSSEYLSGLREWLEERFKKRRIVETAFGCAPLDLIFAPRDDFATPSTTARPARNVENGNDESHANQSHRLMGVHDDTFWSWSFETSAVFRRESLERVLREITPLVARAKGLVRFRDAPDKTMTVQLSGEHLSIAQAPRTAASTLASRIVLIGVGDKLDGGRLTDLFSSALHDAS